MLSYIEIKTVVWALWDIVYKLERTDCTVSLEFAERARDNVKDAFFARALLRDCCDKLPTTLGGRAFTISDGLVDMVRFFLKGRLGG